MLNKYLYTEKKESIPFSPDLNGDINEDITEDINEDINEDITEDLDSILRKYENEDDERSKSKDPNHNFYEADNLKGTEKKLENEEIETKKEKKIIEDNLKNTKKRKENHDIQLESSSCLSPIDLDSENEFSTGVIGESDENSKSPKKQKMASQDKNSNEGQTDVIVLDEDSESADSVLGVSKYFGNNEEVAKYVKRLKKQKQSLNPCYPLKNNLGET